MTQTTKPPKQKVREYLERRTHDQLEPPPTPADIRRELGWDLIPNARRHPDDDT